VVWGSNEKGQLGIENCKNAYIPRLVTSVMERRVKAVSCGETHSALITGF
jgi:alpha-tubulin suppressor-like RCC1 family protein